MDASSTTSLTELLTAEHRLIKRAVVVLARLCAHLRKGAAFEAEAAAELLRFIREYADVHHHAKEEDILFPWMSANGLPPGGPIEVMLADHEEARTYAGNAAEASEALARDGDDAPARARFIENGEGYATHLWGHIWKEDNILYPMAEHLGGGTAGLYDPAAKSSRDAEAVEASFRALVERLETQAETWPREDVEWPQGCH